MSFSSLLFGELAIKLQDSLVNSYLMRLDYKLFGFYPFMELSQTGSPWQIFVPVVFFAFYGLSSLMSLLFAFLLFSNKSRELLVGYIISISLAVVIAMPIWFKFPANSPQNAYINNVYGHKIEENISISLASHKPNSYVDRAYKLSGVKPGSVAPVTTMPSMHVAWGFILLFYFYRLSKKFVFIILPWFVFSSFGTFYLGQHYFVDVPVGLLIGVVADYLGRQLVKLEKKYYQPNWLDRLEERVKGSVALDTRIVFSIIKKLLNKFNIYLNFLKLKRNITER